LVDGGRRWGTRVLRLSGGEPTVGFDHLLEVVQLFSRLGEGRTLVVETNGVLLGYSRAASEELASRVVRSTVVRVSIKGATPQDFERLTGAPAEYFEVQLRAVENLVRAGLEPGTGVTVAVMASFSEPRDVATLLLRLASVDPRLAEVAELEVVKLYPSVRRSLERAGLRPRWYVEPGGAVS
jgi:uncharacterized Fe-S cluster-containing radical SAM superfamily protein